MGEYLIALGSNRLKPTLWIPLFCACLHAVQSGGGLCVLGVGRRGLEPFVVDLESVHFIYSPPVHGYEGWSKLEVPSFGYGLVLDWAILSELFRTTIWVYGIDSASLGPLGDYGVP